MKMRKKRKLRKMYVEVFEEELKDLEEKLKQAREYVRKRAKEIAQQIEKSNRGNTGISYGS